MLAQLFQLTMFRNTKIKVSMPVTRCSLHPLLMSSLPPFSRLELFTHAWYSCYEISILCLANQTLDQPNIKMILSLYCFSPSSSGTLSSLKIHKIATNAALQLIVSWSQWWTEKIKSWSQWWTNKTRLIFEYLQLIEESQESIYAWKITKIYCIKVLVTPLLTMYKSWRKMHRIIVYIIYFTFYLYIIHMCTFWIQHALVYIIYTHFKIEILI